MWLQTQHRIRLNPWRSRIQIARLDFLFWYLLMIHTIHTHSTVTPLTLGYITKIGCPGQWEHQRLLEAKQSLRIRAEIPSVFRTWDFGKDFFVTSNINDINWYKTKIFKGFLRESGIFWNGMLHDILADVFGHEIPGQANGDNEQPEAPSWRKEWLKQSSLSQSTFGSVCSVSQLELLPMKSMNSSLVLLTTHDFAFGVTTKQAVVCIRNLQEMKDQRCLSQKEKRRSWKARRRELLDTN